VLFSKILIAMRAFRQLQQCLVFCLCLCILIWLIVTGFSNLTKMTVTTVTAKITVTKFLSPSQPILHRHPLLTLTSVLQDVPNCNCGKSAVVDLLFFLSFLCCWHQNLSSICFSLGIRTQSRARISFPRSLLFLLHTLSDLSLQDNDIRDIVRHLLQHYPHGLQAVLSWRFLEVRVEQMNRLLNLFSTRSH